MLLHALKLLFSKIKHCKGKHNLCRLKVTTLVALCTFWKLLTYKNSKGFNFQKYLKILWSPLSVGVVTEAVKRIDLYLAIA